MSEIWVGRGESFETLHEGIDASSPGDTIFIRAGVYENDVSTIYHDLTIIGVGGKAHLVSTGKIDNGKAILVSRADVTIENLEFSGASVPDHNGAGVRYERGSLIVRNSYFHDNENGILAASDPDGEIRIEGSEFAGNGYGDGRAHGLYVNRVGALFVSDSYFHDTDTGHHIKSRAFETHVTDSTLDDGDGTSSYSIDLPNGGHAVIEGNTLIQGASKSLNKTLIAFGAEGKLHPDTSLTVDDNMFVNYRPGSIGIANRSDATAVIVDNTFYNVSEIATGPAKQTGNVVSDHLPAGDDIPRPGDEDTPPAGGGGDGGADDTIAGGDGSETVPGGDDDLFEVSGTESEFDHYDGGSGFDRIVAGADGTVIGLSQFESGVEVIDGGGFADVVVQGAPDWYGLLDFSGTTLTDIAQVDGGIRNDTIIGSDSGDLVVDPGTGDDLIRAGAGDLTLLYSGAGNGFDRVENGAGHSMIVAESDGTVIGLSHFANGVDAIDGAGHENVVIQGANDWYGLLDFGETTVADVSLIEGGMRDDTIVGSDLSDLVVDPGAGDDLIRAGESDLTLLYSGRDGGFDRFENGAGRSMIVAQDDGTVIGLSRFADGVDAIDGAGHADVVIQGANSWHGLLDFRGTTLTDIAMIAGGSRSDTIIGSSGDDVLKGGGGKDTFVFEGATGEDRIVDFGVGKDIVDIREAADGIQSFADLDTDGDGVLDGDDLPVSIVNDGTTIDLSLGTLHIDGRTDLDAGDFRFSPVPEVVTDGLVTDDEPVLSGRAAVEGESYSVYDHGDDIPAIAGDLKPGVGIG
ncbi:MAG: hypothetical protein CMM50_14980 [Rhodospirillaceae bacterium]|nr:hypothetical protein [Rhodospirillaceae bacterium]